MPAPVAEHRPIPQKRIFDSTRLEPSHRRSCALTITRDQEPIGAGAGLDVFVDRQRLARLVAGESITVYAARGRHYVGIKPPFDSSAETDCMLSSGHPTQVRISDRGGDYIVKRDKGVSSLDAITLSLHSWLSLFLH